MPRGGARPGSGPKKGSKYRRRLRLEAESAASGKKSTAAQRMAELRRRVALGVADGLEPKAIAAVLGYSVEKLRAVFPHELEHGRAIVRLEELTRLDAASSDGKVSASRIIFENAGGSSAGKKTGKPVETESEKVTRFAHKIIKGDRK
jgi:hypothetical protein